MNVNKGKLGAVVALMTGIIALVIAGSWSGIGVGRHNSDSIPKPYQSFESAPTNSEVAQSASASQPPPFILTKRVAKVDLAQLVAAHPLEIFHKHRLQEQLSLIPEDAEKQAKLVMRAKAEYEFHLNHSQVIKDIQSIVGEYAAKNKIWLVLNSEISGTNFSIAYSSNTNDLKRLLTSPFVHDITAAALQELARQRPDDTIRALGLKSP